MNKKFLSAILFGALMVSSTGTVVSCKDYDDDIDDLQEQVDANKKQIDEILTAINGKKFIQSYAPTEGGYVLTFSDGETLTIKNGEKGEKGDQGLQGLVGPAGETGATIIPKFKTDAESFWMISTDEGTTYDYVLNEAGEKVKATGESGTNNVKVDEEGYICIGEYRTSFKYNANIPSMVYNEKDETMQVTIDGQTYTLLMEGSAFNGLQTIVYRRQTPDDISDFVTAYQLYYEQNETEEDTLFAAVPGKAEFKVYPTKFSKEDAKLFFSDTYQTRAAELPSLSVVDWGFNEDQEGVIWVKMSPTNFKNDDDNNNAAYASSLDVTMYNQYTSASDYFNVRVVKASSDEVKNVRVNAKSEIKELYNQNSEVVSKAGEFDFKATYNLNDSIAAALDLDIDVLLSDANIEYTQKFELVEDENIKFNNKSTLKGIYDADKVAKEGILAVKEDKQSSAIDEFAIVKVTTTVKSQVEGVHDLVIYNYVAIQSVRPGTPATVETIKISPLDDATFTLNYSTELQIVKLDVRAFEAAIGGRDILTRQAYNGVKAWGLYKSVYGSDKKLIGYERAYNAPIGDDKVPAQTVNSTDVEVATGQAYVWYKKAEGNATDSLFLFVGPNTKIDKTTLYLANEWEYDGKINCYNVLKDGIPTPYAISNGGKYFVATINDLSVTRNFKAVVRDEYKAQTIIGVWGADNKTYELKSSDFQKMYTVIPADAKAVFALDFDKQNDYVKKNKDQISVSDADGSFTITFSPRLDAAQIKEVKVDIYDAEAKEENFFRTDIWTVRSPLQAWAGTANLGKYYNPNLANGSKVNPLTLAKNTETAAGKDNSVWKNLVLKDYIDQKVITYNTEEGSFTLLEGEEELYRTEEKSEGLIFSIPENCGWTINATTGELTCAEDPTGTIYDKTLTVTVSYVHDYGTSSFDFTIEVIRDAEPTPAK